MTFMLDNFSRQKGDSCVYSFFHSFIHLYSVDPYKAKLTLKI
jgi:hypothetical protein